MFDTYININYMKIKGSVSMIRRMDRSHIKDIQLIDALAFKNKSFRTPESIESYIDDGLGTGLVHITDCSLSGYIFNHIWGSLSWFGPIGVNPEIKNKGIGKALIKETLKTFQSLEGIDTIMLCTMPDSPYNIGFYSKLGFTPLKLTIQMTREINHFNIPMLPSSNLTAEIINISDTVEYESFSSGVKQLSNTLYQGLDLSPQLKIIREHNYGYIVALKEDYTLKGFAVCYTKAIRETQLDYVDIKLMCISEVDDYHHALDMLLWKCADNAKSMNFKKILLSCNTEDADTYLYLINDHGFEAIGSFLNMVYGKVDIQAKLNGIMLCRFAG